MSFPYMHNYHERQGQIGKTALLMNSPYDSHAIQVILFIFYPLKSSLLLQLRNLIQIQISIPLFF